MTNLLKKALLSFVIMIFLFTATGCNEIIIGTNLEKGDKYYAKGDYQNALNHYMKAAEEYQARLGKAYSNKQDAKNDAAKIVEAYCKSGLTAQKLGSDAQARAMFEKAIKSNYSITESYYVKEEVQVPAGYVDRWVPATNKQVYVDGHYEDVWKDGAIQDVWVDGYYKEVYVDAYYRQDGTYVNGYYKKVFVDGHYEKKQLEGHYEKVWKDAYYKTVVVDGHYEKVYEPAHIEYKDIYKERKAEIVIDSPYIAQAKANLPASTATQAPAAAQELNNPLLKAAYEKMTTAYQAYMKAGSPAQGAELEAYKAAQNEYQKILESVKKQN